jgi:hypothetical protein
MHLRQGNTNRNASISNLVADHKWLVLGTPVNTTIKDLKNQLSVVGIEHVESMFRVFCGSSKSRRTRFSSAEDVAAPGGLLFFLRNVLFLGPPYEKENTFATRTLVLEPT